MTMAIPGEGYVDRGKLQYFGGRPFVSDGEFKAPAAPCEHALQIGKVREDSEMGVWRIPLTYVIFKGHPEEYKTEGYCVHCALAYLMRSQGREEGIP